MSGTLSDLKDRIKETPISQIIGYYIPIERKGQYYLSKCPFHNDTHPSMNINDSRGMFKCFACDAGGDSISFVQDYRNLDFKEALQDISSHLGIDFENYVHKKKKNPKQEMAERIIKSAMRLFDKHASAAPEQYKDFLKNRKLNEQMVKTFHIGYAPGNNIFLNYLSTLKNETERNKAIEIAKEIAILNVSNGNNKGDLYDKFRNRIMFPIIDQYGVAVGFGGRAIFENQKAKYLNSNESFIFNKKNILYGLYQAKTHIRSKNSVILVEGYMDMISMYQAEFENSVAIMGVGLSEYALKQLTVLTKNLYLGLDSDNAGLAAMQRINKLCLENGIIPKHLDFSPAKDPDEFINEFGALELQKRIEQAPSFLDKSIKDMVPKNVPEVLDRKIEILEKIFEIVSPLETSIEATERIFSGAKSLGLKSTSEQILERYQDFLEKRPKASKLNHTKGPTQNQDQNQGQDFSPVTDNQMMPGDIPIEPFFDGPIDEISIENNIAIDTSRPLSKVEHLVLKEILQNPAITQHPLSSQILELLDNSQVNMYIIRLKELYYEIDDAEYPKLASQLAVDESFTLELRKAVNNALFNFQLKIVDDSVIEKLCHDIIKKLRVENLIEERNELRDKQSTCQTIEEENSILIELGSIEKRLRDIKRANKV